MLIAVSFIVEFEFEFVYIQWIQNSLKHLDMEQLIIGYYKFLTYSNLLMLYSIRLILLKILTLTFSIFIKVFIYRVEGMMM
jgi:hypothetical protein